MTQGFNGLTGKFKALYITRSSQQLLVVLYSRGRCTQAGIFDPVRAIQMDHNINGSDKYTRNIHVDNEEPVHGHTGQGSSLLR